MADQNAMMQMMMQMMQQQQPSAGAGAGMGGMGGMGGGAGAGAGYGSTQANFAPSVAGMGMGGCGGNAAATVACSEHGKNRSVKNLMDDGAGGMRCQPGFECQTGGNWAAQQWDAGSTVEQDGNGGNWGAQQQQGQFNQPSFGGGASFGGSFSSFNNFKPGGGGGGGSSANLACSVHGKTRSVRNLVDDGQGGMCCAPEFQCQTGGASGGGQKKYKLCNYFMNGNCTRGALCTFAHGDADLGTQAATPTFENGVGGGKGVLPGDWTCPGCGDHQFARNAECRKCGTPNPGPSAAMGVGGMGGCGSGMGDGIGGYGMAGSSAAVGGCGMGDGMGGCGMAGGMGGGPIILGGMGGGGPSSFGAAAGGGGKAGGKGKAVMPGDWNCLACGDHQFARNPECRKCGAPNPNGGKGGKGEKGASPY